MSNGRFLLIFGLVLITSTGLVRSETSSAEEDPISSDEAEDDRGGVQLLLDAIRDLKQQHQMDSPAVVNKRVVEAAPSVAVRSGSPAAALYRRSALNKNFIRFGRSGYQPTQSIPKYR